jgi:hypothetical protein
MNEKFECNVNADIKKCPELEEFSLEEKLILKDQYIIQLKLDNKRLVNNLRNAENENEGLISALTKVQNRYVEDEKECDDYRFSIDRYRDTIKDIEFECKEVLRLQEREAKHKNSKLCDLANKILDIMKRIY